MAKREMLRVGNNTIEAEEEFAHVYKCGDLHYYGTNCQLTHPFTSEAIQVFMLESLFDKLVTPTGIVALFSDGLPLFVRTIHRFSLRVSSFLNQGS